MGRKAAESRPAVRGRKRGEECSTGDADPWRVVRVIRRLTVGPPLVEPRRVITPYTVESDAGTTSTELAYRFERDVFDSSDWASRNLASMVTAQVALNYGLFADEIRFVGAFDEIDRRFLRAMAENTAREIVVKKFLEPNPFLRGPASRLPATKRARYCHARLRFRSPTSTSPAVGNIHGWGDGSSGHAVLSSGGKDSLLTLGLLREIGCDTYPIFVNESGRHWLTARNAYRYLAEHHPGTGRVWTNSDRVFAWFLRRFPFVRQDFASVRSDEYPVRLWTVAVFLFGALPLMRADGIDRILIGDEFDTTRRVRHLGIPHYDGLFDQSRFFDDALTRYFQKKGFGVQQFSALRWQSEMLIQKTLAERYPDLLPLQVSCHAAHLEGQRVHPCGRCEKCRRIVGMLIAFGLDPRQCGYTDAQIAACLSALTVAGIHQETEGAQHLAHLLAQRGVLPPYARGLPAPRERPEVLMLRFDPAASPIDALPSDIRAPILRIQLEHAQGSVRRVGRRWQPYDPLGDRTIANHQ